MVSTLWAEVSEALVQGHMREFDHPGPWLLSEAHFLQAMSLVTTQQVFRWSLFLSHSWALLL